METREPEFDLQDSILAYEHRVNLGPYHAPAIYSNAAQIGSIDRDPDNLARDIRRWLTRGEFSLQHDGPA